MILKPKWLTKIEPGHRLSKGLVGAWLFNEGGGDLVYDYSGYGNHGTLVGNTHSVSGKFGPALDFDGNGDYINITGLSNWSGFIGTVSINIKIDAYSASGVMPLSTTNGAGATLWWQIGNDPSDIYIFGNNIITESSARTLDVWYNYVFVAESESLVKVYRDGILTGENSVATVPALVSGSKDWRMGTFISGVNWDLNGLISDVTIWDRALSAGEVKELFRDPFQMSKRNL